MDSSVSNNFFISMLKGIGIAFIFTIIVLSIFSCLLVYTQMSENLIQPVVIGVTGTSVLIGSFIANRKMKKNGILNGILIGVLYIGLIYIVSSATSGGDFKLNIGAVIMMIIGIVGGAIGGIMGVNI